MMMRCFHADGHYASVRDLAILMLKLDGRVMDAELRQPLFDFAQDRFAG